MKKTLFLLSVLWLTSCTSDHLNDSASGIAENLGASNYSINMEEQTDNSGKIIEFTLEGMDKVTDDKLSNVTSISAYKLVENLAESDYPDCNAVKVIVKKGNSDFEKQYTMSELQTAKTIFKTAETFFNKINLKDYSNLNDFFDPTKVPDSIVAKLPQAFNQSDSLSGKITDVTPLGFEFKTVDADKKPVLILYVQAYNSKFYVNYMTVFNISDRKIIHFSIN